MILEICPFCQISLKKNDYSTSYSYYCDNESCLVDSDMPRYHATYNNLSQIVILSIMYEGYYITQNFQSNISSISKLQGYLLFDTVNVNVIIPINFENMQGTVDRIKKLLVFS